MSLALQAYNANNGAYPASGTSGISQLESASSAGLGGPYLTTWPNDTSHYTFSLGAGGVLTVSGPGNTTGVTWTGASSCTGVAQ